MAARRGRRQEFFHEVQEEHRRRLERLTERRGVEQLKKLYDESADALEARLRRLVGSGGGETFTAHQHRIMLAQIRDGQARIARELADGLSDVTHETQVEALRALIDDIRKLEKHFAGADVVLPIEEAGRFRGIVNARRESMLRAHEESMANYGATVVGSIEDELSSSLVQGETAAQAIDRVRTAADVEWWRAERIVRTETMFAANATQLDGMREASEKLTDLGVRWEEFVDDDSYAPLDERVANDSIAMHGQIVMVGAMFVFPDTMPDGGPVPPECERYIGRRFAGPPMRPNDRARVSPWRRGWGIPGWRMVGGRRVFE